VNGISTWHYVLLVVGPPILGYLILLGLFRLLAKWEDRRERRRGGVLDLTYMSRTVDQPTRLYDQEADVDAAIALSEELRHIAREARG
jgi:hypothetical protein